MAFFATSSYPELPADNPSLIVAWCHLLHNCGKEVTPEALAEYLSDFTDAPEWDTISKYDPELTVASMGNLWPDSKNSIVRFRIAGPDGEYRDHYCTIFEPADRTIIDSADGCIKSAGVYGAPASAASYSYAPAPAPLEPEDIPPTIQPNPERIYTVLKGERLFHIARKLKISEKELIEHNSITDPYNLPTGLQLHLPVPIPRLQRDPSYDLFDEPQLFHISREGGAQKWFFGNVTDLKDIISGSGMYPQNKEIQVAATATVPVGEETFAYYMDGLALGEYKTTGKVKYTIGFSWADLTPGPAPTQARPVLPPTITAQIQDTIESIPTLEESAPDDPPPLPDNWMSSYEQLREPETYIVALRGGQTDILVHDYDGKSPSMRLRDTGHYKMDGFFFKDDKKYWRPLQFVQGPPEQHRWYGVPDWAVKSAKEVYEEEPDIVTKLAFHSSRLTPMEKYVIPRLAATKLSAERIKIYGRRLHDITKEKLK